MIKIKLSKVIIKNFRCHIETELLLGNLTIFIGENDSGKSAALRAISWLFSNDIKLNEADIPEKLKNASSFKISVEGYLELTNEEINTYNIEQSYVFENHMVLQKIQRFENNQFGKTKMLVKVLLPKYSKDEVFSEKASKTKSLLKELAELVNYELSYDMLKNDKLRKKAYNEIIEQFPHNKKQFEFIELKDPTIKKLLPIVELFEANAFSNPNETFCKTLRRSFTHTLSKDDVREKAESLRDILRKDVKQEEKRLLESIKKYDKSVEDIDIESNIDFSNSLKNLNIFLKKNGQKIDLNQTGDGTKRRIFLGIVEADKIQSEEEKLSNFIMKLYDEPDTSLHYSAEIKLFTNLRTMSKRDTSQVIIATHSITMANQVPLSSLILFKMDYEEMRVNIKYVSAEMDPNNILENLGNSLGIDNIKYYYTKCFIFVEGISEKNALPLLFETYKSDQMISYGISLVNYKGSQLDSLLDFIKENIHHYIVVGDNDKKNDKTFNKIVKTLREKNIFYIGEKEFEDAFSDKLIARVLNTLYPKNENEKIWTQTEIKALRNTDGDFLKNLANKIHTNIGSNFSKSNFALKIGQLCLKEEIPETFKQIFDLAVSYATED